MSAILKMSGNLDIIDKMIENIGKSMTAIVAQVQQCATCIVLHAVEHGDVTRADKLVSALEGARRDSLVQWFLTQGCMKLVENKSDTGKIVKTFGLNKDRQETLIKAIANEGKPVVAGRLMREVPWFQAKKETDPYQPLDLTKALRALLAKAKKAQANPEVAAKSDLSLLASLEKLVPVVSKINT